MADLIKVQWSVDCIPTIGRKLYGPSITNGPTKLDGWWKVTDVSLYVEDHVLTPGGPPEETQEVTLRRVQQLTSMQERMFDVMRVLLSLDIMFEVLHDPNESPDWTNRLVIGITSGFWPVLNELWTKEALIPNTSGKYDHLDLMKVD